MGRFLSLRKCEKCGSEIMPIRYSPSQLVTAGHLLIYGMTSGSLQYRLNKTHEEAQAITNQYWQAFPRVKPWLQEVIDEVKQLGYITYWSGRRWYEEDPMKMYAAANAAIQGGSHDMFMVALLRVLDMLDKHYPEIHAVNLVHDEMDFEMPPEAVPEILPQIMAVAEVPDLFGLPFFTEAKTGTDFGTITEHKEMKAAARVEAVGENLYLPQ